MTSPIPDVTARIRVDTSSIDRAKSAVQDFTRALDRSSSNADRAGSRITGALKFPALISGATLAAAGVSALGGGFVALVGAAAPAVGILGALPVALTAGAQAAGVAALAFRGIGDAVKSLGKVQAAQATDSAAAGAAAAASARAQEAAARGVETAQRALAKAQQSAARAAVDSARQVADARRDAADAQVDAAERVKRAEEDAAETTLEAQQRVADAVRGVADAREASVENVTRALEEQFRAEREVTAAQRDAERAQESLTDARKSAQERIESLSQRLAGAALDERRAVLSLEQARQDAAESQADPKADDLARRSAALRVEEALQGLEDLRRANAKLRDDQAAAAAAGVEGSEVVRNAQEKVAEAVANVGRQRAEAAAVAITTEDTQLDALERVEAAERRLAEAQRESTRDVAQAQQRITEARREGAREVVDAQQRITDAVADQRQRQQDSAESIVEAQRGVQDALRAVAEAQAVNGAAGASATSKLLEGYNALSPAAQRFATFLAGPGKRALDGLSDTAATAFLPLLQTALENVVRVAPRLTGVIDATGGALGRLAIATSDVAVAQMPLLQRVLLANVPLLETAGGAALTLAPAFLQVVEAAQPMTLLLAQAGARAAEYVAAAVAAGSESGRLAGFFGRAYDVASQLGRILRDLAVGIFEVFSGGADSGGRFLDSIEQVSARFRAFTQSAEGQNKIAAYFRDIEPVVKAAARLLGDVAKGFGNIATNTDLAPIIDQLRTEFLPVLGDIFSKSTKAFAPALITLATEALGVFGELAVAGGPLLTMVEVLTRIADAVGDVLAQNPRLVTLIGTFAALSLGLTGLRIILGPLRAAWALAAAAVGLFTAITTASTTATTINGVTTVAHTTTTKASTVALAAQRLATIATTVATGIATVATGAWTVAMTALNVVLRANPIGLVITAIGLLAAGVVIAYRESETFRRIVDGAFRAVAAAGKFMWEDVLKPAFAATVKAFLDLAGSIVDGAAKAFGWVPGIGPKLKDASVEFSRFAQQTNAALAAIKDKDIKVNATATISGNAEVNALLDEKAQARALRRANGGPVFGPGTRTSDSIPALLSNDEHVWSAREVDGAGGHAAMEQLRSLARQGGIRRARGGRVDFRQTLPDPQVSFGDPLRDMIDGLGELTSKAAAAVARAQAATGGGPGSVAGDGELASNAVLAKNLVLQQLGFGGTILGWGPRPNKTEHDDYIGGRKASRALDFMTTSKPTGNAIVSLLSKQPWVDYLIWQQTMYPLGGRAPYRMDDRGSFTANHYDHVHASVFDQGGVARGVGYMPKLTSAPERVLSPNQTQSFERMVDILPTIGGSGQTDALLRELLAATRENTAAVRSAPLAAVDRGTMYGRKGVGVS